MSTSDIRTLSKKTAIFFFIGTALNILFIIIYYSADHGLRSSYMSFSFVFLLLGALIYLINFKVLVHSRWSYDFINAGLVTLSVGMYYHGIIEMAEANNYFRYVFYALGITLLVLGTIFFSYQLIKEKNNHE